MKTVGEEGLDSEIGTERTRKLRENSNALFGFECSRAVRRRIVLSKSTSHTPLSMETNGVRDRNHL